MQGLPTVRHRTGAALCCFLVTAVAVAGCGISGAQEPAVLSAVSDATREVAVEVAPHAAPVCSGTFVAEDLDHLTSGPGDTASTFDGTGAGVGAGDLDGDGDVDLVLPNLSGATTVLANPGSTDEGWVAHELQIGRFRQAAVVDTDGDGDLDIVLTTGIGPPVLFENQGPGFGAESFVRQLFPEVRAATYSMAWGDLHGDGDLDLVTGSYNAELTILRNSPVLGSDTGVILHERGDGGEFTVRRLAPDAQALAVVLADADGDDSLDILVGNDLATADGIWLDEDGGWVRVSPFATSSYSTMSLDVADIDNDGGLELYSTDMAPMADADLDDYREVLQDLEAAPRPDEIQIPENVLVSLRPATGTEPGATNMAPDLGIDATGWSWSGIFGDLDNDGLQDLYVVNGMRSDQLFDFLSDSRLVERNQAFRNTGETFTAADWGLDDSAGGRGMVQEDLDGDGDLDIVVNNLDAPSRLFRNEICNGSSVTAELRWPDSANTRALGSTIQVGGSDGVVRTRVVTSSRGYLSGGSARVHIGIGDAPDNEELTLGIRWPDGETSLITTRPGHHLIISR